MDFQTFVRKPFAIDAVEITDDNIEDLASLHGTLRVDDSGVKYIEMENRRGQSTRRIYKGFWMTKMGKNVRFYQARVFNEQFTQNTPEIDEWVRFMNGEQTTKAGVGG